ncbi:MAG: HPr family phosphocarrier protein [Gemmataceae bacterium]|nr:HPr family phosphocarrier protein [Gemmata sp.]MDW8196728.1 HPr family phosphocarrier protein [Gemmataceae bacterium]
MSGRGATNGSGPRDSLAPSHHAPPPSPTGGDTPAPAPDGPANPTGGFRRIVRVRNPNGLHPRLADRFIRTLKQFSCTATIWNGEMRADGANIWDLISLVVLPESEIVLEVHGPDAARAIETLAEVLGSPGGEDYTI